MTDTRCSAGTVSYTHLDVYKRQLRGRLVREGRTEHYKEILDEVARQSSVCERRADEAERESDKLKKAEYMSYHLGEEYEGIISGVTGWGLYVELPNTVEGLIHINTLRDDYYVFDQDAYELRGDMTGKIVRLGQKEMCIRDRSAMIPETPCSGCRKVLQPPFFQDPWKISVQIFQSASLKKRS